MKKRKRKPVKKLLAAILLQLSLLVILIFSCKSLYQMLLTSQSSPDRLTPNNQHVRESTEKTEEEKAPSVTEAISSYGIAEKDKDNAKPAEGGKLLTVDLKAKQLASKSAVLVRLNDQKLLLNKSSDTAIYPASLTKIMTAIVAIENLDDLNKTIPLPSSMFQKLYDENASMAGFLPDETVPAIDLLYGVILPSGAECCIGLSDYIAGSEDAFVALMNDKAQALNMNHTHFTNSTGLNDPDHYTTVEDLALLLEYALQNDTFREIFTSPRHSTQPSSRHPGGITFISTLFENLASPEFDGGTILGGKTGYTSEAGLCLASLAEKDGEEYILVTAGADGNHDTEQFNISDALMVYNSLE